MSAPVKLTIDDAQFTAKTALGILKIVLRVLRETGKSYQDRILYQHISEARAELERACEIMEQLNPNRRR